MEKMILSKTKMRNPFQVLTSTLGIGNVLGLTIMLEIGDISRFPAAGNYASYCRCVKSTNLGPVWKPLSFKQERLFPCH